MLIMKVTSIYTVTATIPLMAFLKRVYVLDLNATKILFEIQQIMLLDYELSLWNRKHVVFFTLPNHL